MKSLIIIATILFSLMAGTVCATDMDRDTSVHHSMVQGAPSGTGAEAAQVKDDDDFAPGLFFGVLIMFGVLLAAVACGVVMIVSGILLLFALVSFGIVSASVMVGLNRRSLAQGFKTFIVLSSSAGGLCAGTLIMYVLNEIFKWWTVKTAIIFGLIGGLWGGMALGFLAFYILQKLTTFLKNKLDLLTDDKEYF